MARQSRSERKQAVLEAAASMLRTRQVEWASSLTFGTLATATDIDQAQIARDFGDKEALVEELVLHLTQLPNFDEFHEHGTGWVLKALELGDYLGNLIDAWSESLDELQMSDHSIELVRAELLFWAASDERSVERHALGQVYTQVSKANIDSILAIAAIVERAGGVTRSGLSAQEVAVLIAAFAVTAARYRVTDPELAAATEGLSANVYRAFLAGIAGSDDRNPLDELAELELAPERPTSNEG